MRINVYEEEITDEITLVEKVGVGHEEPFYGVRMFLLSSNALSDSPQDDDRSAITFWFSDRTIADNLRYALATELMHHAS